MGGLLQLPFLPFATRLASCQAELVQLPWMRTLSAQLPSQLDLCSLKLKSHLPLPLLPCARAPSAEARCNLAANTQGLIACMDVCV